MLAPRLTALLVKVFVVILGMALGWLYGNSYELLLGSNESSSNTKVEDPNFAFPTPIPDDVEVASKLAEKVRLLCLVPTKHQHHKEQASSVRNTWGKHCNEILFLTDKFDEHINSSVAVEHKSKNSWHRLVFGLDLVAQEFYDDYDWVLKAETNNYVIPENVRFLLHNIPKTEPTVVARLDTEKLIDTNSAYVLSMSAVKKLVDSGFVAGTECSSDKNENNEYLKLSKCLAEIDAKFVHSKNADGRELFLKDSVIGSMSKFHAMNDFRTELSNFTAVWPEASAHDMYVFNFFIYEVRSYGAPQEQPPLSIEL